MARSGGWFRYLRLGCLGAVVLALVGVLFLVFLAAVTTRPAQVEDRALTPEIPAAAGDVVRGGRVVLEIREAELHVRPAGPGEPLRIEASYDVNAYALEGELDSEPDGRGPWTYRATFDRGEGAGLFAGLVSVFRGSNARVEVFLPPDVPLDLALTMREGGAFVRLGGLWLRTGEIDVDSGALDLDVREPTREPMDSFTIRTARGGSLLNRLGNASPRRLEVSFSMGGIDMDLSGLWREDAEIVIEGGMGGGPVHLPAGVILEGLDLDPTLPPVDPELDPPTLRFSVSTGMGYLELADYRLRDRPALPALPALPVLPDEGQESGGATPEPEPNGS
jgi:hypothetical protein